MKDPFARFADLMYRGRWIVIVFWIVLISAAAPILAPRAAEVLKGGGLAVAGTESVKADKLLGDDFKLSSETNLVVVFRSATLKVDDQAFQDQVNSAVTRIKKVKNVDQVVTYYGVKAESLVSSDRHTTLASVVIKGSESDTEAAVGPIRDQLKSTTLDHYVLGSAAAAVDGQTAAQEDLHKAELVTLPLVIILLVIVFRTVVAALVPLLIGLASIGLTVSLLGLIGSSTTVSIFALNVGSLMGLGLAIDYCLIILTRYREELAIGQEPRRALITTMATAGRSIAYSALTVVLAMAAVTVVLGPIVIVRSISLAVMLVAIIAAILAMTMLPALMSVLKHRLEWLRVVPRPKPPRKGEVGVWYRFSRFVMGRPLVFLAICLVFLLGLASPIATIAFGAPSAPGGTEVNSGTAVMRSEFAKGRLAPIYVVVKTSGADGVWTPDTLQGVIDLTTKISADSRVAEVDSLRTALSQLSASQFTALTKANLGQAASAVGQFVNLNGDSNATVLTVVSKYADNDQRTSDLVSDLRGTIVPAVSKLSQDEVYVGGQTALINDFKNSLFDRFPLIALAVGLIILVILMMFFQSLALPFKAVLMNLISIGALFGVLSLVFQHGIGAGLLDFTSTDYITVISPGILYVIIFALSTDYEVFMLARVKEYYKHTGNNEEAVAAGLQHTAGIITAAGLILVLTFGSFLVSSTVVLKEIGLGLAMGVLLDSTIVRVVMVPATMRLLGNGNWYMPGWLKRIIPEISEEGADELSNYTEHAEPPSGASAAIPAAAAVGPSAAPAPAVLGGERTMTLPTFAGGGQTMAVPAMAPAAPAASMGKAELLVSGDWGDGVPIIPMPQDRATRFGRLDSNEIALPSLAVSRWHARIDNVNGQYMLQDLNSANGVYVNGSRIAPRPGAVALRPGDHIVIGGYTKVAFTVKPVA
jgi:RND superfamily putative drug exporter